MALDCRSDFSYLGFNPAPDDQACLPCLDDHRELSWLGKYPDYSFNNVLPYYSASRFLMRLLGKDPMARDLNKEQKSYRVTSTVPENKHMERPY